MKELTEKLCPSCDRILPIEHFKTSHERTHCHECKREKDREIKRNYWKRRFDRKTKNPDEYGVCLTCNETKSKDHFTAVRDKGGLSRT